MRCPRGHGELSSVGLENEFGSELSGAICELCGGVSLGKEGVSSVLGVKFNHVGVSIRWSALLLRCSRCNQWMEQVSIEGVHFYRCRECQHHWFEAGVLNLLLWLQVEDATGSVNVSSLNPLGLYCCDCGEAISHFENARVRHFGIDCQRCSQNAPSFSGTKIQNFMMFRYRGMEVKLDHWGQDVRSRISVTPVEPCLLDVELRSLSILSRIIRFGYRKLKLDGVRLGIMDSDVKVRESGVFALFLKQRGVTDLLLSLCDLGKVEVNFKPHNICFELHAPLVSNDIRFRFEQCVRRLLNVYVDFMDILEHFDVH